jgi:hypothetical protein
MDFSPAKGMQVERRPCFLSIKWQDDSLISISDQD